MSELKPQLSNYGHKRREQILTLALDAARRRRRNRQSIKTVALILILIPLAIVLIPRGQRKTQPPLAHGGASLPANPSAKIQPQVIVVRIADDPDIVRRLTVPTSSNIVRLIGDQQLLNELAAAHEPAGLAYVNGKAELFYR